MKKLLFVLLTLMPLYSYTMHPRARRNLFGALDSISEDTLRENPDTLAEELQQLLGAEQELLSTHQNIIREKEEELSRTDNPHERRNLETAIRINTGYVAGFEREIQRLTEELGKYIPTPMDAEDYLDILS